MHGYESWWIASWILSDTLVGGLIAALAYAANRFWKRPALAHVLWVLVLIKMLTPPLVTVAIPVDPGQLAWLSQSRLVSHDSLADTRDARGMSMVADALGAGDWKAMAGFQFSFQTVVACFWLAGGMGMAGWLWFTARRLKRMVDQYGHQDQSATALLDL
ncbi:MAG: hypothetical protein MI861_16865, partial [Pirellulales bacterium]|nr:hypothetical protein [Pirellulales bacterium]